jgi:hypothetical protein
MNKSLLLVVCFLIGIFIFLLLNRYCECKVVEGLVRGYEVLNESDVYPGVSQKLYMTTLDPTDIVNPIPDVSPPVRYWIRHGFLGPDGLYGPASTFDPENTYPTMIQITRVKPKELRFNIIRHVEGGTGLMVTPLGASEQRMAAAYAHNLQLSNDLIETVISQITSNSLAGNDITIIDLLGVDRRCETWTLQSVIDKIVNEFNILLNEYIELLFSEEISWHSDNAELTLTWDYHMDHSDFFLDENYTYYSLVEYWLQEQSKGSIEHVRARFYDANSLSRLMEAHIPSNDPKNIMLFMKNAYGGVDVQSLNYCISPSDFPLTYSSDGTYNINPEGVISSTIQRHKDIIKHYLISNEAASTSGTVMGGVGNPVSRRL